MPGALKVRNKLHPADSVGGGAEASHDYFNTLIARPDFWKGYSLRPQVGALISSVHYEKTLDFSGNGGYSTQNTISDPYGATTGGLLATYDYVGDTDLHKQDACKLVIPAFARTAASVRLSAGINASDTTLPIVDLPGSGGSYYTPVELKIDDEIILCGAGDGPGNQITGCTRGRWGTTPASHLINAPILRNTNTLPTTVQVPLGTSDGHSYLFTTDVYWTDSYLSSGLTNHKLLQFICNSIWLEQQNAYNGDPGHPVGEGSSAAPGFDTTQHISATSMRTYNIDYAQGGSPASWAVSDGNTCGPNVTNEDPFSGRLVNTFIIYPNRWTRFWWRITQVANDWDTVSMWIADELQSAVKIYDEKQISVRPSPGSITHFLLEWNTSTDNYRRGAGQRDWVSYMRNFVGLIDPPADITALLRKPV